MFMEKDKKMTEKKRKRASNSQASNDYLAKMKDAPFKYKTAGVTDDDKKTDLFINHDKLKSLTKRIFQGSNEKLNSPEAEQCLMKQKNAMFDYETAGVTDDDKKTDLFIKYNELESYTKRVKFLRDAKKESEKDAKEKLEKDAKKKSAKDAKKESEKDAEEKSEKKFPDWANNMLKSYNKFGGEYQKIFHNLKPTKRQQYNRNYGLNHEDTVKANREKHNNNIKKLRRKSEKDLKPHEKIMLNNILTSQTKSQQKFYSTMKEVAKDISDGKIDDISEKLLASLQRFFQARKKKERSFQGLPIDNKNNSIFDKNNLTGFKEFLKKKFPKKTQVALNTISQTNDYDFEEFWNKIQSWPDDNNIMPLKEENNNSEQVNYYNPINISSNNSDRSNNNYSQNNEQVKWKLNKYGLFTQNDEKTNNNCDSNLFNLQQYGEDRGFNFN